MKSLLLIDDHAMLRDGIASWISRNSDWYVAIQAESLDSLISQLDETTFNAEDIIIAIVDISLKSKDNSKDSQGFEIVRILKRRGIPSIIFSSHDSGGYIEKAMSTQIGAFGYVSKTSEEKVLLDAINTVAQGKTYIQPDLFANLLKQQSLLSALSPKERQIANLLAIDANSTEEISKIMGISERTVQNYIAKLYDKTGTSKKEDLLAVLGKD